MDRKLFSEIRKSCKTKSQRLAFNRLVKSFASVVFIVKDNFVNLINSLGTDEKISKRIDTLKNPRTILEIGLAYIQLKPEGSLKIDYWVEKSSNVGGNPNMLDSFKKAADEIENKRLGKYGKLIRYINEADEIYKTLDVFDVHEYVANYHKILSKMSLSVGTYSKEWHLAIQQAASEIGEEIIENIKLDLDDSLRLSVHLTSGGNWNENYIKYYSNNKDWAVTIWYKYDITQGKLVSDPRHKISWSGTDAREVQRQVDLGDIILDELTNSFKNYNILDSVIIALAGGADKTDRYKVTLYSEWTKMLQEMTGENIFIYGDKLGGWGSMSSGKENFTVLPMHIKTVGAEKIAFAQDSVFKEIVERLNGFKKGMARYVKSSLNSHYGYQYIELNINKLRELWNEFHPKDKNVAPVEEVKTEVKTKVSELESVNIKEDKLNSTIKKLIDSSEQRDKMKLWNEGKRNFNFRAATDDKLIANYIICLQNGFNLEVSQLENEAKSRGIDLTEFVDK